jgi:hypothetical protein
MEGKIMLDRSARLNGLDFKGGADVGEHRRAEGKRLGVVLLPALVLSSQIKGSRMLEVGREDNSLVASFSGKLNTKVPSIEGNENEVEVLGCQVFGGEGVESCDSILKSSRISNMFPRQGG